MPLTLPKARRAPAQTSPERILVCLQSNAAVDMLTLGFSGGVLVKHYSNSICSFLLLCLPCHQKVAPCQAELQHSNQWSSRVHRDRTCMHVPLQTSVGSCEACGLSCEKACVWHA